MSIVFPCLAWLLNYGAHTTVSQINLSVFFFLFHCLKISCKSCQNPQPDDKRVFLANFPVYGVRNLKQFEPGL